MFIFYLLGSLLNFPKSTFSKSYFRNNTRESTSLDTDRDRHFVGPDLSSNCLQSLSADDTGRQRVNLLSNAVLPQIQRERLCTALTSMYMF